MGPGTHFFCFLLDFLCHPPPPPLRGGVKKTPFLGGPKNPIFGVFSKPLKIRVLPKGGKSIKSQSPGHFQRDSGPKSNNQALTLTLLDVVKEIASINQGYNHTIFRVSKIIKIWGFRRDPDFIEFPAPLSLGRGGETWSRETRIYYKNDYP